MKKIEFLKELEERLVVLNEKERLDILEEYEQHIDMKIAGGMREDEAIEDFGNLKELVDDILDAYRVNLKYNKADPLSKMASGLNSVSSNITKAYNKTMEGSKIGRAHV